MPNITGWINKPPIDAPLNFGHPIMNQMVLCVPFWEGGGNPKNIIRGVRSVVTNTLGWSTGFFGLTRDISPIGGSNSENITMTSAVDWQHGPFTVMVLITFRSFQTSAPNISGIFYNNGSGGNSTIMRLNDGSTANNAPNWIVVSSSLVGNARLNVNVPYQMAMSWDGTTLIGYINGAVDSTKAVGVTAGAGGNAAIFWKDDSVGRGPDAKAHVAYIWKRVLSSQEISYLYTNPFGMFLMPRRRNITQPSSTSISPRLTLLGVG